MKNTEFGFALFGGALKNFGESKQFLLVGNRPFSIDGSRVRGLPIFLSV